MTVKTLSAAASAAVLSGALFFAAGCTTQRDTKLPPGSYIADPVQMEEVPSIPAPAADIGAVEEISDPEVVNIDFEKHPELVEIDLPSERSSSPAVKVTTPVASAAVAAPVPKAVKYTIKKGDTLSEIAAAHKTTVSAIANYNGINAKSTIYPGKVLMIPGKAAAAATATAAAATTAAKTIASSTKKTAAKAAVAYDPALETLYVVKSGDTLGGIAAAHSIRVADLAAANNIDPKKMIVIGQKLVIPKVGTVPAAAKNTKKSTADKPAAAVAKAEKPAAPAPVKETPVKEDTMNTESAAAAVIDEIGTDTSSAPVVSAAPVKDAVEPVSAAATAESTKPAASASTLSVDIPIDTEMTLEEIAEAYEYPVESVKKLNPNLSGKIPAGTLVKIPFF